MNFWPTLNSRYFFLFALVTLVFIGFLAVFSASVIYAEYRFSEPYFFVRRHLINIGVAVLFFIFAYRFNYRFWEQMALPLLFFSFLFLLIVLFWGKEVAGARRWLSFWGLNFQPSELAKFSLVVFLARHLDRYQNRVSQKWKWYLLPLGIIAILSLLIIAEPDLGTVVLLGSVGLTLMFVAGVRKRYLFTTVLIAVLAVGIAIMSSPYRRERLMSFLHYQDDPLGSGYQIIQSLIAFGQGGFFGKGPGAGTSKLLYLPEAHTDFILTVLGEEFGFVGLVIVLLLFLYVLSRGFQSARDAPDFFASLLAYGLSMNLGYQALINLGMVTACLPTKGIPFPFLSYGGSAIFFTGLSCGIILQLLSLPRKGRQKFSSVHLKRKG